MSSEIALSAHDGKGEESAGKWKARAISGTLLNIKSGKQVANREKARLPKNDSRYWLPRIFKPVNDRGAASPHYAMRVAFKGQRRAFTLGTGNKDAAARRARDIYEDLLKVGVKATLAKHRTQKPVAPDRPATVGEWITAAEKVFDGSVSTIGSYARCLRAIAAEILSVEKTRKRFARRTAAEYREAIDAAGLDIFTPDAVQAWRIAFVQKAAGNPAKQRTARISCNSMVRQARALFSKRLLKFMTSLRAPDPLPFADVEFYPRESMRYQSKIDPASLLALARRELAQSDPEAFKALLLALAGGLRRGEIDRLLWRQVSFGKGVINVEATEAGGLKSEDSAGRVAIDPAFVEILRAYHSDPKAEFVIAGGEHGAAARAWGQRYRCADVFKRLNQWLRSKGVSASKPLHTLRKEAGSIIATKSGIHAASQFLRHSDIQVTAQHYADHKERVAVDLGGLLGTKPARKATRQKRKSA